MQSLDPPILVETEDAFDALLESIQQQARIAIDTESNSLFAYQEQVCLIQLSTAEGDYLIDALALHDLRALGEIMASERIEKVLHGAEYDIACLKRDFDFTFRNLFDTRVAARHLGWEHTGLADMLLAEFGAKQKKRHQRANWGKRPLTEELMHYARMDTHFLSPLRDRMAARVRKSNQWEQVHEMFEYLKQTSPLEKSGKDGMWSIKDSRKLAPQQAAVLNELYQYRERRAQKSNRPVFKVLHDRTLLQVAEGLPKTMPEIRSLKAASDRLIDRYGPDLLKAVDRGLSEPELHPPKRERLNRRVHIRLEAFKRWRKKEADASGIESDLILPRTMLFQIASEFPKNKQELQQIMRPLRWRFELYAANILEILKRYPED
jgi:ribonuclease D